MSLIHQFDAVAGQYRLFRPHYPKALYAWLASLTGQHEVCVDCGTGNGQAAIEIAPYFQRTIALDSNANQIKHAVLHPLVDYHCLPVEAMEFSENSVDLIISASAAHWFDLPSFYSRCHHLLKFEGYIVLWTYTWPKTDSVAIQAILDEMKRFLDPYWSPQSLLHLNEYKHLPFPFQSIDSPSFQFDIEWDTDQLLNFLATWAAIQEYLQKVDVSFLQTFKKKFQARWPSGGKINFVFPLYMKAGKNIP